MTKEEYIKQQAEAKYPEHPPILAVDIRERKAFTSGAELMLEHMPNIIEWIDKKGFRVDLFSPQSMIDLYFDQLPKTV